MNHVEAVLYVAKEKAIIMQTGHLLYPWNGCIFLIARPVMGKWIRLEGTFYPTGEGAIISAFLKKHGVQDLPVLTVKRWSLTEIRCDEMRIFIEGSVERIACLRGGLVRLSVYDGKRVFECIAVDREDAVRHILFLRQGQQIWLKGVCVRGYRFLLEDMRKMDITGTEERMLVIPQKVEIRV